MPGSNRWGLMSVADINRDRRERVCATTGVHRATACAHANPSIARNRQKNAHRRQQQTSASTSTSSPRALMKMVVFLPARTYNSRGSSPMTPATFVHFLLSPLRKLEVNVLRRRVPFAEGQQRCQVNQQLCSPLFFVSGLCAREKVSCYCG